MKKIMRAVLRGGMGCWLVGRMARLVVGKGKRKGGSRRSGWSKGRRHVRSKRVNNVGGYGERVASHTR